MQSTRKIRAAREALLNIRRRDGAAQRSAKMLAAGEALAKLSDATQLLACRVSADRLILGCDDIYMALLLGLKGYRRTRSAWLRRKRPTDFLPYRRITVLKNTKNSSQIFIYTERNSPKLEAYRIILVPDDAVGQEPRVVRSVLECIETPPRIALLEVALDFPDGSGIDGGFVRRHGLFGKCKPYSVGKRPGWDAWGSRKGAKFVRSYHKTEVGAHRVELQLQPPFLRQHGIKEISDFPRLAKILPRHHVWFARLSEPKLARAMRKGGTTQTRIQEIRSGISTRAGHLCGVARYLRRTAGLENVRRLSVPLGVNEAIREALKAWAGEWSTAPTQSKGKP
jgi:hypothetical protein